MGYRFTNTLTGSELETLNYRLKTFEDSTSNQLAVLMIPTLGDYPIEYLPTMLPRKIKSEQKNIITAHFFYSKE